MENSVRCRTIEFVLTFSLYYTYNNIQNINFNLLKERILVL